MGKIKKILENELVGGTQTTDVYPVTSIKAVYDEDNERLDNIINRKGVVNISTNYNSDHIAEVLTLEQAIAKVPSKDRVLGFQGKFQTSEGWKSYIFTGDSVSDWSDLSKWIELISSAVLAQELGDSTSKAISQNAVTKALEDSSEKINNKITELENESLYYSVDNKEFYKENVVVTSNRNETTTYYFSSNLNIKGSIIGVRVVESCEMKIVTVADLDNPSDNTISEHTYILKSGINILESPIILEENQYLAFSKTVYLIQDYGVNLYNVSDGSKTFNYAICASVIISDSNEYDSRLPKLESEVPKLDGKLDNLYNNFFYRDYIDKNLDIESLKIDTYTESIYYSGIHTEECGGVLFKAKKGVVKFYKVKVESLGGDGTSELLDSIENTQEEEGTIKSAILGCKFAENEYLGISGDIYFGRADGYSMYVLGNATTPGYALAYIPFINVNSIHKELYKNVLVDKNLKIKELPFSTDTADIYYSGIYCKECTAVSYKAKEGVTRFYKVVANTLGGEATSSLLKEFTNTKQEEGVVKTVNLNTTFDENEYLGISGAIYYGVADGYTMYQIGSGKTDNYALAYMPIYEVSVIEDLYSKISELQKVATNIFEVGADRKYKTINDAVNDAVKVGTKENPAVIMIYPGIYNEYCNIFGKQYLSIIGVDKKRCIWRYDDANYHHAPLRIAGNCYVKNITFITTAKDYISDIDQEKGFDAWKRDNLDGHYPPGYPTWLGKLGCYAVHCDDEHNDDGELVVSTFEDCVMYSETMPAFGAGLWPSYKIELIRCDLIGKYDKEFYDHVNLEGSLYVHGLQAGQISGVYKEHLYMKDCTVITNYKRVAKFQKVASKTEDLNYLFYYNIFDSDELAGTELITFDGVTINRKSYGNNTTLLNGIVE